MKSYGHAPILLGNNGILTTKAITVSKQLLKVNSRIIHRSYSIVLNLLNAGDFLLKLNSTERAVSVGLNIAWENHCLVFRSSTKREIRNCHVVVVQQRQNRDVRAKFLFCESKATDYFLPFSLPSSSPLLNLPVRWPTVLCSCETVSIREESLFYLYLISIDTTSCPASRGYIFAGWAGVRRVASADNCSIFYRACAKLVMRFVSKIKSSGLSSNGASFAGIKKLRQLWSATQDSRNALNRSRTGKTRFFSLFVQISGRIWTVVGRGYFSHASSHSENVASARRVTTSLLSCSNVKFVFIYDVYLSTW